MKFTCSKEALDRQLQHVGRIITVRNSLPVLSNLLLETDKNLLRISGTDLEIAMTTHVPAEVKQEGAFTVPAKLFQEFVHQNPDEQIDFSLESFELVCKSNKVEARISGLDAEEYPPLPQAKEGVKVRLPLKSLVEALKQAVMACAVDASRPVLTAVYLRLEGESATIAATDSFRLVERTIPIVPIGEALTVLVPVRTMQELVRISAAFPEEEDVEVEVNEQQILFRIGTIEMISQLITGAFPKYHAIIPQKFVAVADVTTAELVQALRLSTIFSQAGVANVMLEITAEGALTISSYGSQRGTAKHTIYAVLQEGFAPVRAAFNAKFLLDACSASNAAYLQMHFSGPLSAMVVRTEDPSYLHLVMPIRLDN